MSDSLYDMYEIKYANSTAKGPWDDLNHKYMTEDDGNKKFLISKLFDFCMVDSKFVITQIHELQMIMNLIISEGHSLDESFQVSTIISKVPLASKECRKELKQKQDAMTMQELVEYIQVEENSRNLDRLELEDNKSSKALVVDQGSPSDSQHPPLSDHRSAHHVNSPSHSSLAARCFVAQSVTVVFIHNFSVAPPSDPAIVTAKPLPSPLADQRLTASRWMNADLLTDLP
ncbi:hypothetical protein RJ639_034181 [Escallonia herrerae]|uniref:Uncharacterized protein n=1 Tax=Escallonia herrerae TaxID=1293975 RepID=A0AA88WUZ4_9ASTE|nr:hypothetical protein RJ639_034181 [Escallonia herrerae]